MNTFIGSGQTLHALLASIGASTEQCSHIVEAYDRSELAISRARESLQSSASLAPNSDLVGFGSLARYELTPSSDLDYLFVSTGATECQFPQDTIDLLRRSLVDGVELSEPGNTGLFGARIHLRDLTANIGLQRDSNESLSRRILFLEESISLSNVQVHARVIRELVSAYLAATDRASEVPRFLLNDIIRYWRTLAVDYQAKRQSENHKALRYLKLLISRKLCYVSSLAPLFFLTSQEIRTKEDQLEYLTKQYCKPSSIRMLELLQYVAHARRPAELDAILRIVHVGNEFLAKSGNPEWRKQVELDALHPDAKGTEAYGEMRKLGKQLHEDIVTLFSSQEMLPFTREYMLV